MRQKVKRIKFNDTTFKRAKLHLESQLRYLFVLLKSIDPFFSFNETIQKQVFDN